jgi:hypothetical protein
VGDQRIRPAVGALSAQYLVASGGDVIELLAEHDSEAIVVESANLHLVRFPCIRLPRRRSAAQHDGRDRAIPPVLDAGRFTLWTG